MSAVLQDTEASVDQLPLIQAPAHPLVRWSLWGRLTKQAEVRIANDGGGMLIVQVMQPKNALPFVAVRHEPASQLPALRLKAQQMRPGVAVLISGLGFELTPHDGAPAIRPRICEAISLADFCFVNEDGSTT